MFIQRSLNKHLICKISTHLDSLVKSNADGGSSLKNLQIKILQSKFKAIEAAFYRNEFHALEVQRTSYYGKLSLKALEVSKI